MRCFFIVVGVLSTIFICSGCGNSVSDDTSIVVISGRVQYERREYIPALGHLGPNAVLRPVRHRAVIASSNGFEMARTLTDNGGNYQLRVHRGLNLTISCMAACSYRDSVDGIAYQVVDPGESESTFGDEIPYNVSATIVTSEAATVDLLAPMATLGGAFAIADAIERGFQKLRDLGWITNPAAFRKLTIQWRPGMSEMNGNKSCYSNFLTYPFIYISSYESGKEDSTAADEWSPSVIIHEMGHYVCQCIARDDSNGGIHFGADEQPHLVWSEGFANFWSYVGTGSSRFVQFFGYGATGSRFEYDGEAGFAGSGLRTVMGAVQSGLFSELAVSSMLLDVFDGPLSTPVDTDSDGMNGRNGVLFDIIHSADGMKTRSFVTFADFAEVMREKYFLQFTSGLIPIMQNELIFNTWPLAESDSDYFPKPIQATQSGVCYSNASNYFNAIYAGYCYELELDHDAVIRLQLSIAGTGTGSTDLDLWLFGEGNSLRPLAVAKTTSNPEIIVYACRRGKYLVRVQSHSDSILASYDLTYQEE